MDIPIGVTCQKCGKVRMCLPTESLMHILNKEGWRYCEHPSYMDRRLLCKECAKVFEEDCLKED